MGSADLEKKATELDSLNHVRREIPGGGEVYVLDTGAVIDSEGEAMLQALHSRSVGGLKSHLEALKKKGAANFMNSFYVGYGHKSIGDCGSTTIFIEGVSMFVAKAIQDNRLYNGQEASTRYIDFSRQPFVNPIGTAEGQELLESQRRFYLSILDPIRRFLKEQNPQSGGEKDSVYEKAINARAFDIARGFLPAGAATNLAWHSNLRQVSDRLLFLRHHPLEEVRNVAHTVEGAVLEAHPNSFTNKRYSDTESYQDLIAGNYFYHNPDSPDISVTSNLDLSGLRGMRELIDKRPEKTELPKFLSQAGTIHAEFKLDFGSFRDLQRHRALDQRMPLLTTDIGFNSWYLENLPEETRGSAEDFLANLRKRVWGLNASLEVRQYYVPMGFNTSNSISGDLPAMLYMVELRSTRFVHPTLRRVARGIGEYIGGLGVTVHFDSEPDRFDVKRGEQDIFIK